MGHVPIVVSLGLGFDAGFQVLVKLAIVAGLWTGKIGGCCPVLAERHQLLILLMHHTYPKETVLALAEHQ